MIQANSRQPVSARQIAVEARRIADAGSKVPAANIIGRHMREMELRKRVARQTIDGVHHWTLIDPLAVDSTNARSGITTLPFEGDG